MVPERCITDLASMPRLPGAGPIAGRIMWLAARLGGMFAWRGRRAPKLSPIWSSQGLPAEPAAQEAA